GAPKSAGRGRGSATEVRIAGRKPAASEPHCGGLTMTTDKGPSFLSIFPILAKLLLSYGKRLLSVDTLVSLEKKTGAGSGERTPEEIALDQALERNPHQLQIDMEPGHKPTPSIAQLLEQSAGDRLVVNEEAIRAARNPK
ncbi:hypothetical protein ACEP1U_33570, partial [Pseudomonas aeruginosa]